MERKLGSVVGRHRSDRVGGERLIEPGLCVQGALRGGFGKFGCMQEPGGLLHGRGEHTGAIRWESLALRDSYFVRNFKRWN